LYSMIEDMIDQAIIYLKTLIAQYGAWGVFAATIAEEIIAPIPSPFVPLSAGFLMFPPTASIATVLAQAAVLIALPVAIGVGIGSSAVYAIGFYGGHALIERWQKFLGFTWRDVERVEARLTSGAGDELVLFLMRILPVIPGVAISGFCGIVRYPFRKFIAITMVGSFIRALLLGVLGWKVGEVYNTYADAIAHFEKYLLVAVLVSAVSYGGYAMLRRRAGRQISS